MFFGNEMRHFAKWNTYEDACSACLWIFNRGGYNFLALPAISGGYYLFGADGMPATKGYIAALMARHDTPPMLKEVEYDNGKIGQYDAAGVPFVRSLPYFDTLPKERPV